MLLLLWEQCLEEKLTSDVKSRIIGCNLQMRMFSFFFGLCLGQRLYGLTDSLSKTLQKEKMSALSAQRVAKLTLATIEGMRNEESFHMFFKTIEKKAMAIPDIETPVLPRKRRRPNYSMLHFVSGGKDIGETAAHHPETVEDYYRQIFYEAVDSITLAIKTRFDQQSYQVYLNIEQLLLRAIRCEPYEEEMNELISLYGSDVCATALPSELEVLKTVCSVENPVHFDTIVSILQEASKETFLLIPNVIVIVKILLVNAATSATPERSFSMDRRIKTWLRTRMTQQRFNALAILNDNKDLTDDMCVIDIGNEFVKRHSKRYETFGTFTANDI